LLKILEEPAADTFFILVSAMPAGLLATIRSRCQQVSVLRPGQDEALSWLKQVSPESNDESELLTALQLAAGSPLRAFDLLRDGRGQHQAELLALMMQLVKNEINPVLAAKPALDKTYPQDIYDLLYWLLSESLRRCSYELSRGGLSPFLEETIDNFSAIFSVAQLLLISEQVVSARRLLMGTGNPNQEQLLESVLILLFEASQKHLETTLVE
jgi:DNA polymerase-3 subunit delta'